MTTNAAVVTPFTYFDSSDDSPARVATASAVTTTTQGRAAAANARRASTPDPDHELVERWKAGDEDAFGTLVGLHEQRVFGLLMRMLGNREEAEDVAQETFLNLHRHGRRFRGDSRFSTFVYRVAANAALNYRRSQGRNRSRLRNLAVRHAAGDDLPWSPRCPEQTTAGDELASHVRAALDALPEPLRLPIVLYDLDGVAYGEIAEILGVEKGTVKSRIHRGRKILRDKLRHRMGMAGVEVDATQ